MLTEKGMKNREKLGPIFDKEAVKVVYSVSDQAVAKFKEITDLFHTGDRELLLPFLDSRKSRDFVAAYLQDQERPERFEMVTKFLLSPVRSARPTIVLNATFRYWGADAVSNMLKYLSQNPEHLAEFMAKEEVVETLTWENPGALKAITAAAGLQPMA